MADDANASPPKPIAPKEKSPFLGRASQGKAKNLKSPPLRKHRLPYNASDLLDPLKRFEPGQTDLTLEQARVFASKLGVKLPPGAEKIFLPSQDSKPKPDPQSDSTLSSPALIKPKSERDKVKLGMMLPYTSSGFFTFYDMMYRTRGFRLERHLMHIVHGLLDDRIKKLLVCIGPGSGKSALLSTVFPAFRLGTDPAYTILGISAGEALMQGFQSAVMEWIEHSPEWKMFFPNVRPDKSKGWSTERGMFVTGHPPGDPDASYLACGLTSKRLTGVHARLILGDDIHDEENSTSAESCAGVITTFYRQIMGRADPRGARFVFAGRRWHEEDLYGHLKNTGEWVVLELPAIRDNSDRLYWDITIPDGLECCFTEIMRGEAPSNLGDDVMKLPTE